MIRYLTDLSLNESFDLPMVKNIAKRFLAKMQERRDIIAVIYVMFSLFQKLEVEDAKARGNQPPSTPWKFSFNYGHPRQKGNIDVLTTSQNNENNLVPPQTVNILDILNRRQEDRASQQSADNQELSEERPARSTRNGYVSLLKSKNKTFVS